MDLASVVHPKFLSCCCVHPQAASRLTLWNLNFSCKIQKHHLQTCWALTSPAWGPPSYYCVPPDSRRREEGWGDVGEEEWIKCMCKEIRGWPAAPCIPLCYSSSICFPHQSRLTSSAGVCVGWKTGRGGRWRWRGEGLQLHTVCRVMMQTELL